MIKSTDGVVYTYGRTIKDAAYELLLETAGQDKDGRPVGWPYDVILTKIMEEFPEAETSVKCLRWYAVKLNSDPDVRMPIRPRKRIRRSKKENLQ